MIRYGTTTLQLNTWYHIAGVYDAARQTMDVYLNGQLDDGALIGTVTSTQQNSTQNVKIGATGEWRVRLPGPDRRRAHLQPGR